MALLTPMLAAARAASEILADHFRHLPEVTIVEKSPSNFVSNADVASENCIKRVLRSGVPGARFQAEETATDRAATGARFIIDPLDGTTNFIRGIPHFAISIAYWEDDEALAAVVVDPSRGEVFYAERGQGAFVRGPHGVRHLPRLGLRSLDDAVVHTGIPHRGRPEHAEYLARLERVMPRAAGIRRLGAAALDLAYVAAGRGDAFFESGLQPWDMAAGIVLVREVGGIVTDFAGELEMMRTTEIVAGAPGVHGETLACVV